MPSPQMRPTVRQLGSLPGLILALLISSISAQQFYGGLLVETTQKAKCTRHTKAGDLLTVNYRGTLQSDGTEFDSSYGLLKEPFQFTLGEGQVIKGWDQGLVGMCIGEHRKLTIPPELAYGSHEMGKIPADSTLIFETELLGIEGVEKEEQSEKPNVPPPTEVGVQSGLISGMESGDHADSKTKGHKDGPKHDEEEEKGECKLLGPFALFIQGALGMLALLSLVWKRYRETPRRPLKVWFFDASKQVAGSMLLHLANLVMSILSSGDVDLAQKVEKNDDFVQGTESHRPNPCSFYLLNLAIDTTIGIPILVLLLRIFHKLFLHTPLANPPESLRSGNYGTPPRGSWWAKQALIYFLGLLGMKLCVFLLFQLLPWIGWVGEWALRWTEGKAWVQITFVMLIFPLFMNALQYYIIDSFIKDPAGGSSAEEQQPGDEDDENEGLMDGRRSSDDDGHTTGIVDPATKEANPTAVPIYNSEDERLGSSGSSRGTGSTPGDARKL